MSDPIEALLDKLVETSRELGVAEAARSRSEQNAFTLAQKLKESEAENAKLKAKIAEMEKPV